MQFTFTFALQRKELISGCHDLRDTVCVSVREMWRCFAPAGTVWSYGNGFPSVSAWRWSTLGPSLLSSSAWPKSRLGVCRTCLLLKAPLTPSLVHSWLLIPLLPLTVIAFHINTSLLTSWNPALSLLQSVLYLFSKPPRRFCWDFFVPNSLNNATPVSLKSVSLPNEYKIWYP